MKESVPSRDRESRTERTHCDREYLIETPPPPQSTGPTASHRDGTWVKI